MNRPALLKWAGFFGFFILTIAIYSQALGTHGIEFYGDEVFYYKSTQEMLRSGDYMSPTFLGHDRFQKPILYYWLILFCYKIFGPTWFAARFVNVASAGLIAGFTWLLGLRLFGKKSAMLGTLILLTMLQYFRFARVAVPDMTMNLFIVAAIYYAFCFLGIGQGDGAGKKMNRNLFFVMAALGFMIKGFAALVVPFVVVILLALFRKKPAWLKEMNFPLGIFLFFLIISPWFLYMVYVHGDAYLNHMLVEETKNRMAPTGESSALMNFISGFLFNLKYYLEVILVDMLPWSIFFLACLPLAVNKAVHREKTGMACDPLPLLIWFFSVLIFFCIVHIMHDHYMLVMTTPVALLAGFFFTTPLPENIWIQRAGILLKRFIPLTAACLAVLALFVFLYTEFGIHPLWLAAFILVIAVIILAARRLKSDLFAPVLVSVLVLFLFSQTQVLADAGFSKNAVFQKYAANILSNSDSFEVGIASPDIRLSDVQAYFDQEVKRVPEGSDLRGKQAYLKELFERDKDIYSLVLDKDYPAHFEMVPGESYSILARERVLRRKFRLDTDFLLAFLKRDKETVSRYLTEEVYLIAKTAE